MCLVIELFLFYGQGHAQIETPYPEVTPQDLINAFNLLRAQNGYPSLIVDPILMYTAQQTADIMAINQMTGHIGDVRGRVMAAGYGAGDIAWATENFMTGPASLDQIMLGWSDELHMIPANNPYYEHIGAGIAEYSGVVYYVVHAAYTSDHIYKPATTPISGLPTYSLQSQIIYPVQTATPRSDGRIYHIVKQGQTLWSIAIAYGTKIAAIISYNNISPDQPTIYIGERLYIPVTATPATPTLAPAPNTSAPIPPTKTIVQGKDTLPLHPASIPTLYTFTATSTPHPVTGPVYHIDGAVLLGLILCGVLGVIYVVQKSHKPG